LSSQRTFDQILGNNGSTLPADTGPHKALQGSVVLEPLGKGIRVTGRDNQQGVLWGFVASKGMLDQPHASIAIYNLLRDHLYPLLESMGLPSSRPENIMDAANSALADMEYLIKQLRENINVKKASPQTLERAEAVHRAMTDATRMVLQEITFVSLER
jgi:hypothetical protein